MKAESKSDNFVQNKSYSEASRDAVAKACA